jgi:two-component system, OmpR family, response regulator
MNQKILLIVNDLKIEKIIDNYFENRNFEVITESTLDIENINKDNVPDIILSDFYNLELFKKIRSIKNIPIITLNSSSDDSDTIISLELGADDCISVPFNPRELLARVKAVLRRSHDIIQVATPNKVKSYKFDSFELNIINRTLIECDDSVTNLTNSEFELLSFFVENPGIILQREKIRNISLNKKNGDYNNSCNRFIDAHVSRLRAIIQSKANQMPVIQTVRGVGYIFAANVEAL